MEITLHTYANLLSSGQMTFSRSLWITVHMSQDECLYIHIHTTAACLLYMYLLTLGVTLDMLTLGVTLDMSHS